MKKIILASTSPRRREILKKAGFNFEVISPNYEEQAGNRLFSYEFIELLAKNKGESIQNNINDSAIIISADTVVVFNNKILGKPANFDEAVKMLKMLNGNSHKVVSAICLIDTDTKEKIIKTETSEVTFNKVFEEKIISYIENHRPYDKAGSYGIQELPKEFIKEIKGDYENIVGLPLQLLKKMINQIVIK